MLEQKGSTNQGALPAENAVYSLGHSHALHTPLAPLPQ
jgi:hypothetical protein